MPPRANLDDISKAIGGLEARADNTERATEKADNSRAEIHRKMEQLGQEMISINNKLSMALARMEKIEPEVADWKKLRQNVNGGLIVLAGIGAALFTVLGFVIKDLWAWAVAHIKFH